MPTHSICTGFQRSLLGVWTSFHSESGEKRGLSRGGGWHSFCLSEQKGGNTPNVGGLRPIFREQPQKGKNRNMQFYEAIWKPKQMRVIFPDFLDTSLIYANLKLSSGDLNAGDPNEGHQNPCKMKRMGF